MAIDDAFGVDIPTVVALLDENTANRIAAGEVIERPSSVVKELVENAIDAGATRIEVELEEGGKRRIVVRDNGSGMGRADAVLALQRHATSKIRSSDDLFSIRTLGFRGEALPSIASVSDFQIVTKRQSDDAATEIVARGGDIIHVVDAGAPDGTTIIVENLFFNTPARLKFLKTTQTELNQAVDLINRLILAYHVLSFKLTHDGYEMIAYPGAGDARIAVAAVWGRDVARDMVPLEYESPGIAIRGFVSKPSVSRASRNAQYAFVNGRFVRSRTVMHAFDAAFKSLMTSDRHPILALFVDIAPELVDVNVSPAKTEVRFTRDGDVYAAVHRAVQNALLTGGLVPEVNVQSSLPLAGRGELVGALPPKTALSSYGLVDVRPYPQPEYAAPFVESLDATQRNLAEGEQTATDKLFGPTIDERSDVQSRPLLSYDIDRATEPSKTYIGFDGYRIGRLRVLAQSRNTYIVAETDDAILLIDQHIAHERVLYEQMMNGATDRADRWGVVAQHLALPQTLHWGARGGAYRCRAAVGVRAFRLSAGTLRRRDVRFAGRARCHRAQRLSRDAETHRGRVSRRDGIARLLVPHESAIIMASCKRASKRATR